MSAAPVLRITVEDLETGEQEVTEIPRGEYVILTTFPCYVAATRSYPTTGCHVITVEGRTAP
jgi:hypothetical protein